MRARIVEYVEKYWREGQNLYLWAWTARLKNKGKIDWFVCGADFQLEDLAVLDQIDPSGYVLRKC